MKKIYLLATALAALVSCTSDEYVGEKNLQEANVQTPISFNYELQKITRDESDHATSATNLGNQFIVWGEKSSGAADTKDAPAAGHIVFPNYQVNYVTNTANTTTSNTKDWEYVGYTHSSNYQSNITYKKSGESAVTGSTAAQTIKYWDYSAGSYTFTAVSASKLTDSKTDIENGYVKIQKIIDDDDKASEKGYKVTVTANADLTKLYFSDRTIITATPGTDRTATNAYGGNVTLKFRNALSQIRAGVYETISGYDISDIHFYITGGTEAKVSEDDAFGAICPNIKGSGYAGDLTVTYSEEASTLNQPIVSAGGTLSNDLILGTNTNDINKDNLLGKTAAEPTWDTSGGDYTTVMLQGAHTINLELKCKYTLYNSVSGEEIVVDGATAVVPYKYLQWKPNYKYTYLFKISDNTNGSSGQGVVGLYPITFDAIEIVNGDGLAEYITTVSEPSITTFGVKDGKYTAGNHGTNPNYYDYPSGSDIYATIMDGGTNITPTLGTNVNIYKNIISSDATNFPVTEASLAEAIAESGASEKITYTLDNAIATVKSGSGTGNGIPGEDGNEILGVPAVQLASLAAGTYAIEYIKTPAAFTTDGGHVYTFADENEFNAEGKLYTTAACDVEATYSTYTGAPTATYYKKIANLPGTKVYKIIVVK